MRPRDRRTAPRPRPPIRRPSAAGRGTRRARSRSPAAARSTASWCRSGRAAGASLRPRRARRREAVRCLASRRGRGARTPRASRACADRPHESSPCTAPVWRRRRGRTGRRRFRSSRVRRRPARPPRSPPRRSHCRHPAAPSGRPPTPAPDWWPPSRAARLPPSGCLARGRTAGPRVRPSDSAASCASCLRSWLRLATLLRPFYLRLESPLCAGLPAGSCSWPSPWPAQRRNRSTPPSSAMPSRPPWPEPCHSRRRSPTVRRRVARPTRSGSCAGRRPGNLRVDVLANPLNPGNHERALKAEAEIQKAVMASQRQSQADYEQAVSDFERTGTGRRHPGDHPARRRGGGRALRRGKPADHPRRRVRGQPRVHGGHLPPARNAAWRRRSPR